MRFLFFMARKEDPQKWSALTRFPSKAETTAVFTLSKLLLSDPCAPFSTSACVLHFGSASLYMRGTHTNPQRIHGSESKFRVRYGLGGRKSRMRSGERDGFARILCNVLTLHPSLTSNASPDSAIDIEKFKLASAPATTVTSVIHLTSEWGDAWKSHTERISGKLSERPAIQHDFRSAKPQRFERKFYSRTFLGIMHIIRAWVSFISVRKLYFTVAHEYIQGDSGSFFHSLSMWSWSRIQQSHKAVFEKSQ